MISTLYGENGISCGQYKVTKEGSMSSRITFSKMALGSVLIRESSESGSPSFVRSTPDGWKYSTIGINSLSKKTNKEAASKKQSLSNRFFEDWNSGQLQTGEQALALRMEATVPNAKLTLSGHLPGRILTMDASEFEMLARPGSFMVGQGSVLLGYEELETSICEQELSNAGIYKEMLGFSLSQKIYGTGHYWLEMYGNCSELEEYYLFPGEAVEVEPANVIAWSKSVKIIGTDSQKADIRKVRGADFQMKLQANVEGGYVITSDWPQIRNNNS